MTMFTNYYPPSSKAREILLPGSFGHLHKPAETAGELLDAYKNEPPSKVDPLALQRMLNERGRRSAFPGKMENLK